MRAVKKLLLTICVSVGLGYLAFAPGSNQTVIDISSLATSSESQTDQSPEKIDDTPVKEETQDSKEQSNQEDKSIQKQEGIYTNTYKAVTMAVQNKQTQVTDKGIQGTAQINQYTPVQHIEQQQVKAETKQETEKVQETSDTTTEYQAEKLSKLGEQILKGLSNYENNFDIEYTTEKEFTEQIEIIRRNYPLVGYNITSYGVSFSTTSSAVNSKLRVVYKNDKDNMDKLESKLHIIVNSIIKPEMTTLEKVQAIHDYVINSTKYDTTYTIYDAYSTLMSHTGVCEGYALLTQEMLSLSDIESMVVVGTGNGESHAWNLVKIEGKWRHIDTTWDDPVTDTGEEVLRYDYFNKTDEEIIEFV